MTRLCGKGKLGTLSLGDMIIDTVIPDRYAAKNQFERGPFNPSPSSLGERRGDGGRGMDTVIHDGYAAAIQFNPTHLSL